MNICQFFHQEKLCIFLSEICHFFVLENISSTFEEEYISITLMYLYLGSFLSTQYKVKFFGFS